MSTGAAILEHIGLEVADGMKIAPLAFKPTGVAV